MLELFAHALIANGCLFSLVWVLATYLSKVSLIDIIWGPSFAVTLTVCLWHSSALSDGQWAMAILIYVWAARLALHLLPRGFSHGEDARYTAMRKGRSPRFFIVWSLFGIFGLQAFISLGLSTPFVFGLMTDQYNPSAPLPFLGLLLAAVGLAYETLADYQLKTFLAKRSGAQAVCNVGLWKWSRHPNYFGEALFWWGIWVSALTLGAPFWTIYAPVGLNLLLLKVSGVSLMESTITTRRPQYAEYIKTTNAFIPGPSRLN